MYQPRPVHSYYAYVLSMLKKSFCLILMGYILWFPLLKNVKNEDILSNANKLMQE